jgi:hypothetical protein
MPKPNYTIRKNCLSLSLNPNAIHILEQNMNKVNWYLLSRNPNAIYLLEQNIDKIDWINLSKNPNTIINTTYNISVQYSDMWDVD